MSNRIILLRQYVKAHLHLGLPKYTWITITYLRVAWRIPSDQVTQNRLILILQEWSEVLCFQIHCLKSQKRRRKQILEQLCRLENSSNFMIGEGTLLKTPYFVMHVVFKTSDLMKCTRVSTLFKDIPSNQNGHDLNWLLQNHNLQ